MKNISKIFFIIFVIQILTTLGVSKNIFPGLNYLLNINSVKAEIPRDFFLNAIDKKNKGDLKNAIIELNKALDINPFSIKAIWYRGTIYFDLKEFEKAINDFNFVIEADTKSYEALLFCESIGFFCHTGGSGFKQAPPKSSSDGLNLFSRALEKRGISKFFLEDYAGAAQDLLFLTGTTNISPSTYKFLAISFVKLKLYTYAIPYFQKAIKYEPSASLYKQSGINKIKAFLIMKNTTKKVFSYCGDFINADLLGSNSANEYYFVYCKDYQPCITETDEDYLVNFCKKEEVF